ncbi:GntR family transcriptional regulator [Desulfatiglans anilini]|uniref:GntR family transcriptional regulator n=1 Tax=Desulfatiglans anilini TaxID=90728 RepID=UPI00047F9540|nr:GntR family transcriptional regulator [Desulfatiglans anilini]
MKPNRTSRRDDLRKDHAQIAYRGIRRMLYHKEIVPGQKVACGDVAEQLHMSPTPVIQALKWLEFQGFVRHEPNRGYFMEPFRLEEIEEIYELRELIEPSLIPSVVRHLDENGAEKLRSALEAHRSVDKEAYLIQERLFKNREFHLTLASLSRKSTQIRILGNIFDLLFLKYGGNYFSVEPADLTDQAHKRAYDCILARDAKGAQEVLSAHITSAKEKVLAGIRKFLEKREEPEF